MKRQLLHSASFRRAAKHLLKRQREIAPALHKALRRLEDDAFDPALRTHKLKGELDETWSCSCGTDLRIVFRFVRHQDVEAIELLTVGSHDEVY